MAIEVRIATTREELRTCLRLRWTVFVEEQGVPPSLEVDEHDHEPSTVHVLGLCTKETDYLPSHRRNPDGSRFAAIVALR